MSDPKPDPVVLKADLMPGGYNWPDGSLAVWRMVTRPGWLAAPLGSVTDGIIYPTAAEAAAALGAVLP